MSTLITQQTFDLDTITLTLTHGLGTTPHYIIFENLDVTTLSNAVAQVIAATATNFYVRGGGDYKGGVAMKATVVRIHSIVA